MTNPVPITPHEWLVLQQLHFAEEHASPPHPIDIELLAEKGLIQDRDGKWTFTPEGERRYQMQVGPETSM